MTAERERLLQKIKRVQALAQHGVDGERDSAAAMLEKLMKQYGIAEADIAEERREMAWFRFKAPIEEKLLGQVIYSVMGDCPVYDCKGRESNRKHKVVGCKCTAAERLEIELSFEFFNRAMQAELERFISAFINKNRIFPPQDKAGIVPDRPEMSREEIMKLAAMMEGMDTHTRQAMLESGGEE